MQAADSRQMAFYKAMFCQLLKQVINIASFKNPKSHFCYFHINENLFKISLKKGRLSKNNRTELAFKRANVITIDL